MITDKVETYCKNAGMSISRFEKFCGLANGSVGKWRKNHTMPQIASLLKMEKATGIPAYMWIEEGRV